MVMSLLRFGDRVLTVNGRDLRNILRKEAADILRTCDHLSITMEIRRCRSQLKTRVQVLWNLLSGDVIVMSLFS